MGFFHRVKTALSTESQTIIQYTKAYVFVGFIFSGPIGLGFYDYFSDCNYRRSIIMNAPVFGCKVDGYECRSQGREAFTLNCFGDYIAANTIYTLAHSSNDLFRKEYGLTAVAATFSGVVVGGALGFTVGLVKALKKIPQNIHPRNAGLIEEAKEVNERRLIASTRSLNQSLAGTFTNRPDKKLHKKHRNKHHHKAKTRELR